MINAGLIYDALFTLFDNDSTMKSLLKRGGDSKVFRGIMPNQWVAPALQILIMTDNQRNTAEDFSELSLYINAHTQDNMTGLQDYSESSNILARVNTLIDDKALTVTGHAFCKIYVEGRNPIIPNYDKEKHSIEGLQCRMFAA